MIGYLMAIVICVGSILMAVIAGLVKEEVRGWLELLPHAVLRLAGARLDDHQREAIYKDEWLPELAYILKGVEARPITRLILGVRFSFGILFSSRRIARTLGSAVSDVDQMGPANLIQDAMTALINTLPPREAEVISMRFGLTDGRPRTLQEIGEIHGLTRQRIHQIEGRALSRMRHPSRSHYVAKVAKTAGHDPILKFVGDECVSNALRWAEAYEGNQSTDKQ